VMSRAWAARDPCHQLGITPAIGRGFLLIAPVVVWSPYT
jgi:hypothetical protein